MILSSKRITKSLIRLRGYAGWSAPLLFANLRRQVLLRRGPGKKTLKTWPEVIKLFSCSTVGILTFMSRMNFVLSRVVYEKSFVTSGPDQLALSDTS